MSAVWRAARAAVRRRRLQTVVIGVVALVCSTMAVVALGLLAAANGPFDQAYEKQAGAHVIASFDPATVTDAQLTGAARAAAASAGPFVLVDTDLRVGGWGRPVTLVGRDGPGGAVDRVRLTGGRWVTGPGEIVLARDSLGDSESGVALGGRIRVGDGGAELTVVGFAFSVSGSADGWVTAAQAAGLRPSSVQMLYRFAEAATAEQLRDGLAAATAGVPAAAMTGDRSYLAVKMRVTGEPATLVPFLAVFGVLGLAVAILIVANVVSGAVVAGIRHIGVLKALGFTPDQVLGVYLTMVSAPAIIGCVLGVLTGNALATPLLTETFEFYGGGEIGVAWWVDAAVLAGLPAVVALAALVPAMRARRLPAARAISAGSAPRTGRGLRIQRRLGGSRLPRSVSLGLGLPFARPARNALTAAAVILGVTSVTFAVGLGTALSGYVRVAAQSGAVQAELVLTPEGRLSDAQDEALLRAAPGVRHVTPSAALLIRQSGTDPLQVQFFRGSTADVGYQLARGHRPDAPGEIAVSRRFLSERGLDVGDEFVLDGAERLNEPGEAGPAPTNRTRVRIVGEFLTPTAQTIWSNWATLELVAPGSRADSYSVGLAPGTDTAAYLATVLAGDPGLHLNEQEGENEFLIVVVGACTLLTLMLGTVAALGVFNTVVLNTRERRRDLGMLKSIGMTPRQVTAMMVTSMAALGLLGGLLGIPAGIAALRVVVPLMGEAAQVTFPAGMLDVYPMWLLTVLALAGAGIAALGAYLPSRSAARLTIAEVLHNE